MLILKKKKDVDTSFGIILTWVEQGEKDKIKQRKTQLKKGYSVLPHWHMSEQNVKTHKTSLKGC